MSRAYYFFHKTGICILGFDADYCSNNFALHYTQFGSRLHCGRIRIAWTSQKGQEDSFQGFNPGNRGHQATRLKGRKKGLDPRRSGSTGPRIAVSDSSRGHGDVLAAVLTLKRSNRRFQRTGDRGEADGRAGASKSLAQTDTPTRLVGSGDDEPDARFIFVAAAF